MKWKLLNESSTDDMWWTMDVEGGYVLRHTFFTGSFNKSETMVFIPNIPTVVNNPITLGIKPKKEPKS